MAKRNRQMASTSPNVHVHYNCIDWICITVRSFVSNVLGLRVLTMRRGWDNTGANGANLSFPQEFGIADQPWLIGVINAGPTLFGLLSAWAADPVNNLLGRRGTIFFTGLFVIFPVLAQAFTQNWWGLMVCRLFMGTFNIECQVSLFDSQADFAGFAARSGNGHQNLNYSSVYR
jgi:MFS family permease